MDQEHITVMSLVGLAIAATRAGFSVRRLEAAGELDLELICKSKGMIREGFLLSEPLGWGHQRDLADANFSSNCSGVFQKAQ